MNHASSGSAAAEACPSDDALPAVNRVWPFAGGEIADLGQAGTFVEEPLAPAAPHEVVARIDAVCICSSDIKIIRMGTDHPLLAGRDSDAPPVVLGHEMALTVCDVGENWRGRFRPGQRLGLQPAITVDGVRRTVGMDLPGGFAEFIRLDARVLAGDGPFVFPVPDEISAATVAMLEPYSCVETAYRMNCRTHLREGGRRLIVGDRAGDTDLGPPAGELVRAETGEGARGLDAILLGQAGSEPFDDILVLGPVEASVVERLLPRLAKGGLMALVGAELGSTPIAVDAARIHYHEISILGGRTLEDAFDPARHRFELKPGGVALILGAGGAMGRIHLHRALELEDGPETIIATSRKGARCDALRADFGPLAERRGRRLVVVEDEATEGEVARLAPDGCDDVIVVAPDAMLIERGATLLKPDGMLVLFAGTPFGRACRLPLGLAASGMRFTGSTGSVVADQLAVLERVSDGSLDLSRNLEAVAGLSALPEALAAVAEGRVSGKIAIYPARLDLGVTPIRALARASGQGGWTRSDERRLVGI